MPMIWFTIYQDYLVTFMFVKFMYTWYGTCIYLCWINFVWVWVYYALCLCFFNTAWSSDAVWRQRSGPTLAQAMTYCMNTPSPYLNQCWLIISKVPWKFNFIRRSEGSNKNKNCTFESRSYLPGANELGAPNIFWLCRWNTDFVWTTLPVE